MTESKKKDTELNELESDLIEAAEAMLEHSFAELNLPSHDYTISDKDVLEKPNYND